MEKPWYEYAETDEDRLYEESVRKITGGVKRSLTFEQAAALVDIKEPATRNAVIDDALKVLIAEMHFAGGKPLDEVAKALGLPLKRLEKARAEMLADIEAEAIEKYKSSLGQGGSA